MVEEDQKREDGDSEPVNINIVKKDYNKENIVRSKPLGANRPRPPPAVGGDTTDIYENIDVKDINSKLSRLQDLLKKAKNN
jgi:hypothetical protein